MNNSLQSLIKKCLSISFIILFFIPKFSFSQSAFPAIDDEFVGPFSSWINVKTQYGAVGDGVTDETAALQAAFNAIGNNNSTASVVYIPAGTYKITGTLTMNYKMSISLIGEDPANTKIIWAGANGATMLLINGTAYSRFNRIKWDGNNLAAIAVDQSYSATGGFFDTGNEYADDNFSNVGTGLRGGFTGNGFAETAVMRCTFHKNTTAGISLGNFNALDCWVWHSVFDSCTVGLTNANPSTSAGNFRVYNCVFRSSTTSDVVIGNNGEFSFRDNTSTNSQAFIKATSLKAYPYHINIQGNKIIDPLSNPAIDIRNQGPVVLLDNIFRSRAGASAPVVAINPSFTFTTSDLVSMGNTFTIANAINSTNAKSIIYDNPVVTAASLSGLTEQTLPGTQPNLNRTVFEVPAGSNGTIIQSIINQAAMFTGYRPVIHLPYSTYNISSTLNIPVGSDMQIVGDGDGDVGATWLMWTGSTTGPVFKIAGPSKVALRDFSINGNGIATNILITNVDQSGARIFMHEFEDHLNQTNLFVNGLDNALVLAQNSRFSGSTGTSVNVVGGSLAAGGNPQQGRTITYGSLSFQNNISYQVTSGANLLVRDIFYEPNSQGENFLNLPGSGTSVIEGGHLSTPRSSLIPQFSLTNFSGKATILNTYFWDTVSISGNASQTKFLGLGVQFGDYSQPVQPVTTTYINNTSSSPGDIRSFNCRGNNNPNLYTPHNGSFQVNDIGTPDSAFIAGMIAPARNVHAQVVTSLPNGTSDVRLYRLWSYNGLQGMELQANTMALGLNFISVNTECSNGSVTVKWLSARQINLKNFEIEKSLDGNSWNVIGSVAGAGSSSAEKTYSYIDKENSGGFYRIVAYDIYGKKTYSSVIKSSCNDLINSFSVVPNPVSDVAIVSIVSDKSSPLELSLFDSKGALVKKIATKILPGNNKIEVNMKELINGIYILRTSWAGNVKVTRLKKINK